MNVLNIWATIAFQEGILYNAEVVKCGNET
jgi:hypothetical protein